MNIIEVKNLYFSHGENRVLENIDFTIEENEMVTIVGPNGGGKTTLLRLMLGLLTPDKGKVLINGKAPAESQRIIGYVPQYSLFDPFFPVTVLDVVLMGSLKRSFGFYKKEDVASAKKALETVGLQELTKRPFSELSGGQRQRVLIARALVSNPKILMLDEPTANVDAIVGSHLNSLLQKLSKTMTIILVTHDTAFVSNLSSRIFCINKGFHEHPTEHLDKNNFTHSLYGTDVALVRHDLHLEKDNHIAEHKECTHG